jgi:hypothetical protein
MYKIVIVGAGQLGSRHLQGVLSSNLNASIEVVDSSKAALVNAQNRADEIKYDKNHKSILFHTNLENVSKHIDLCIIASTSNVRFNIIQTLISLSTIRYLILEKILFQELNQYDLAEELLSKNGVQTWVNCPRRMVPAYKTLKSRIKEAESVSFVLLGGNWGLGCNAIHFIDLFAFLTNNSQIKFNTDKINKIIPAKREGFYELVGTLTGSSENKSEILLQSKESKHNFIGISILTDNLYCTVNETHGIMTITDLASQNSEEISFFIPFQSKLTRNLCEELLISGHCDLTDFSISSQLHRRIITSYLEVFKNNGFIALNGNCPIT